jgi:hypothetical protein
MNLTVAARKAVYRWLYQRRVEQPGVCFSREEIIETAVEPHLSAALAFGLEMGHMESERGHWRLTAFGMLYAEMEGLVEGEE